MQTTSRMTVNVFNLVNGSCKSKYRQESLNNKYTGCLKKKFPTKNAHFKGFRVILEQNVRE